MVQQDMIVMLGDLRRGKYQKQRIADSYSDQIYFMQKDSNIEQFPHGTIMVADWRGWTNLSSLERKDVTEYEFVKLTTKMGKSIILTKDHRVAAYNPEKIEIGFHGETLYEMKQIRAAEMKGETVHIRNGFDQNGIDVFFDTVTSVEDVDVDGYCYMLTTKHGFCNCNDIYICTMITGQDKNK